ncbi:MAG: hypothetical protein H6R17_1088 [Proteobacteria bacterium]|nr:hypothetical protein [Pseudomonadota bacterium]
MFTPILLKRIFLLIAGLFVMAFGVALSVKANLGTSPISSLPYVLSLIFPWSMGVFTMLMNSLLVLSQVFVLKRDFRLTHALQIPIVLIFSLFTDWTLAMVSARSYVTGYPQQMTLCLISVLVVAFGVFLEVKAKLLYMAGEGVVIAIVRVFKREFGKVKIGFDCTLVTLALICSLTMLHELRGIREGTVLAALLVGFVIRLLNRHLKFVDRWVGNSEAPAVAAPTEPAAATKFVVTIAREYGSGGHAIGAIVARRLGIPFYDKNLIALSAAEARLSPDYVEAHEQKLASALLYELYSQNYAYVDGETPPLDALFLAQTKIVHDLSEKESCVIVGRNADFILRGRPDCLRVFVHADRSSRIGRIIGEYGIDRAQAARVLETRDRERANYCEHYTHQKWGMLGNYDLTIDSSRFGIERTAELIVAALLARTAASPNTAQASR